MAKRFANHAILNTAYTSALTLSNLNDQLLEGFTWVNPSTQLTASDNQQFPATYANPCGNNGPGTGYITVNVAKADQTLIAANLFRTATDSAIDLSGYASSSVGVNSGEITYQVTDTGTTVAYICCCERRYERKCHICHAAM